MQKAIIMAGGQGTRLRPLTLTRPKPLLPVANRPVLAHILDWLRGHGFSEVLLTLHYRADDIRRAFGTGRAFGLRVTYRVEEQPLGTAGSIKAAEEWIGDEPFLIASGDALTDVDLAALARKHEEAGAWMTLGLKRVPDPSQYGVVALDDGGRVLRFQEKPGPGQAFSNLVNTGIYRVEPQVLGCVPPHGPVDWSRDIFPRLLADGLPLFGHGWDGYWCDIGCIADYHRGQRDALEGRVRVSLPATPQQPGVWIGPRVSVAGGAVVQGPVLLGAGCRIERGASVLPGSVLGERTVVRSGACVWNAVLGASCEVGPRALVRDCVVGEKTTIGAGSTISDGAVIGDGCLIAEGVCMGAGQRLEASQPLSTAPRLPTRLATSRLRRRAIPVEAPAECLAQVRP